MKKQNILIIGGLVAVTIIVLVLMGLSANNREIDLRNRIGSQKKVIAGYQDKMWKILKQKAKVSDEYRKSFDSIYTGIMAGRYANGGSSDGSLMKMITESNPNFDASLYKDLMNSIEIERDGFFAEQSKLADLGREHDNIRMKFPSKWFVDAPHIEIRMITSAHTEEVMRTGQDNDISLFDSDSSKK